MSLPVLLIMIFVTNRDAIGIIKQPFPDQQTCNSIEQDIVHQIQNSNAAMIVSKNCYQIPGGMGS